MSSFELLSITTGLYPIAFLSLCFVVSLHKKKKKEKMQTYGYMIVCDGWTGPMGLSIINFIVYLIGNTIFLKSFVAQDNIKDNKYIYHLLKNVVKKKVVQNKYKQLINIC